MNRKESAVLSVFIYSDESLKCLQNNSFDLLEIDEMKAPFPGVNVN